MEKTKITGTGKGYFILEITQNKSEEKNSFLKSIDLKEYNHRKISVKQNLTKFVKAVLF